VGPVHTRVPRSARSTSSTVRSCSAPRARRATAPARSRRGRRLDGPVSRPVRREVVAAPARRRRRDGRRRRLVPLDRRV